MSKALRIIFAGTPDFAAAHLQALLHTEHQIVGVLTQPDRPAGRGKKLTASPVKILAQAHQLAVFQPPSLRNKDNQVILAQLQADIMVVVAYGLLLPQEVLDMPRLGCINVHASLLPRWRGAAPIQRAIWAGDEESGITIMKMDAGLDTGDMLQKISCPIQADETGASLYEKLAQVGPQILIDTLDAIEQNKIVGEPQNNALATYAKKLTKEEAQLDWSLGAKQLERCIRAFNPWPGSYFVIENSPIKVWQANVLTQKQEKQPGTIIQADRSGLQIATAEDILNITQVQPAGKKIMSVADLLNSRKDWFEMGKKLQ